MGCFDDVVDLFAEVDEDLRAEQARAIARKYGLLIIGLVLAAVVAVGVWQMLAWQRARTDTKLSAAYFAAMHSADQPSPSDAASREAIRLFAPLAGADATGIRTLTRLRLAQLQGDAGDAKAAIADLDQVANDPRAASPLRDLATLASVQRQLATGSPAEMALRLQGIEQPGAPFRALALETSAMIDLAQGRTAQCRRTLQLLLADEDATDAIRERANTLLQAVGPEAAGK